MQLSGGQRQRVALARAIVNEPEVLLLDEPLGALDLKLRQEMQTELKRIQREVGITFVYVTHDQEEALTMSDRIAVMNRGRIEQLGSPTDVYERPATEFVAGFIGVSNLIERDGRRITVRPEKVRILEDGRAGAGRRPRRGRRDHRGRSTSACSPGTSSRSTAATSSSPCARISRPRRPTRSSSTRSAGPRRVATRSGLRDHRRVPVRGGAMMQPRSTRARGSEPRSRRSRRSRCVLAACGSSSKSSSTGHTGPRRDAGTAGPACRRPPTWPSPTSIGKGEGKLNLIAWEGYTEPAWVKPFEQQTGCQVNAKYAGTSSEMVSLMANGGGGQYDLVSASGDADLRLIYGGDVRPVNVNLIPSWKDFHPFLKSPSFNTIDGMHYGVSLQFGPNVLLYSTTAFPTAPTSWSTIYSKPVQGQGHACRTTRSRSPTPRSTCRRRTPSLGITDPYELTQTAVRRGGEPAEATEAAHQEVLEPRLRGGSRCSRTRRSSSAPRGRCRPGR